MKALQPLLWGWAAPQARTDTEATVVVTVAPGATLTVNPHPSGIPEVGPLILGAGSTHRVSQAEARRLYDNGTILDPATGRVKPPAHVVPPRLPGVTVYESQEEALKRTAGERAADAARALRGDGRAQPRMVRVEGGWQPPPDVGW